MNWWQKEHNTQLIEFNLIKRWAKQVCVCVVVSRFNGVWIAYIRISPPTHINRWYRLLFRRSLWWLAQLRAAFSIQMNDSWWYHKSIYENMKWVSLYDVHAALNSRNKTKKRWTHWEEKKYIWKTHTHAHKNKWCSHCPISLLCVCLPASVSVFFCLRPLTHLIQMQCK